MINKIEKNYGSIENYNEAFKFMEARELSKEYESGVLDFARHLDKIEDREKEEMGEYYEKLEKANRELGLAAANECRKCETKGEGELCRFCATGIR